MDCKGSLAVTYDPNEWTEQAVIDAVRNGCPNAAIVGPVSVEHVGRKIRLTFDVVVPYSVRMVLFSDKVTP